MYDDVTLDQGLEAQHTVISVHRETALLAQTRPHTQRLAKEKKGDRELAEMLIVQVHYSPHSEKKKSEKYSTSDFYMVCVHTHTEHTHTHTHTPHTHTHTHTHAQHSHTLTHTHTHTTLTHTICVHTICEHIHRVCELTVCVNTHNTHTTHVQLESNSTLCDKKDVIIRKVCQKKPTIEAKRPTIEAKKNYCTGKRDLL